jgi:hypothetical protein
MRRKTMRLFVRILAILLALSAGPVYAESHALIMTIGDYINGVTPLVGSKYDIASARAIANKMGVKDQNIRYYRDAQLTIEGIHKAFDDLYQRVGQNDQVFIYYSGHGGRWRSSEQDGRCAVALVSVDGNGFMDTAVQAELNRLSTKAQKIVMFADACHSGGVKSRSIPGQSTDVLTPRFWSKQGPDACAVPVNVVARNLRTQSRITGSGANNVTYIAAAREDEVSWDMGKSGGAATQAWRDCITGAALDKDNSGGLTAAEIQQCAQGKVNQLLKQFEKDGVLPSHVTIAGNSNAVLAFAGGASQAPGQSPAPALAATAPVADKVPLSPGPPAVEVARPGPPAYYTLLDIYNNRDDRRIVTLTTAKQRLRIGKDDFQFSLNSSHPGYVYLLMVGSDGKEFDMIFPNKLDSRNEIGAGQTLQLPRSAWRISAAGPAGKNHLLAIVTDAPRDFSRIGMQSAGPFSVVAAAGHASRDIQLVTNTSVDAGSAECSGPSANRTLRVQMRCSNAYGAALLSVEEID